MPKQPKQNQPPEGVEVFFDVRDGGYWYRLNGRYVKLKKSDIHLHFRHMGLRDDLFFNGIREIDWPLWNAQVKRLVDYAGDLAGHRAGVFTDSGGRTYLAMNEARGVWEPVKKTPEPKWFKEFIQALLEGEQWSFFCHWLAISLNSLREHDFRPGQVVIMAGPAQCGKSLLQAIVTEILGGRCAKPFNYMMGITQFNQDLAGAEHWMIEDPDTTTDIRARRSFGNKLKECAGNAEFNIQGKGKDALPLKLFRRITVSVNDEPENVAVVPPMDASIADKIFLFRCTPVKLGADRKAIWDKVQEEVPLIRTWLLRNFLKVPKEFQDDRCSIKSWHHPELMEELTAMAPETRLMSLIDAAIFEKQPEPDPWTGKAVELENELRESKVGFEIDKMLKWSNACGVYLSRLAKQHPDRVTKRVKDGYASWVILAPSQKTNEKDTQ
jgi:hypothetical protein